MIQVLAGTVIGEELRGGGTDFRECLLFQRHFCLPICRELVLMWCGIGLGKYSVVTIQADGLFSASPTKMVDYIPRKSTPYTEDSWNFHPQRRKTCVDGVVRVRSETRRAMLRGLKFNQQNRLCTPQWRSTSTALLLPLSVKLRLVEFRIIWRCEETRKSDESVRKKWREEIRRL